MFNKLLKSSVNVELSSLVNVAIPVEASKVPLVILAKLVSSRYSDKSY